MSRELKEQCEQLGDKFMFEYLAYGGSDDGEQVQFEIPKNLWNALLAFEEKIKDEKPEIYEKVKPIKELQDQGLLDR